MKTLVEEIPGIDIKEIATILDSNTKSIEFFISDKYTQNIDITTTEGNFGGLVYWFVCPGCKDRIKKLYLFRSKAFICKNCLGLTYKTQAIRAYRKKGYTRKGKPRTIKDSIAKRDKLLEELKKYMSKY